RTLPTRRRPVPIRRHPRRRIRVRAPSAAPSWAACSAASSRGGRVALRPAPSSVAQPVPSPARPLPRGRATGWPRSIAIIAIRTANTSRPTRAGATELTRETDLPESAGFARAFSFGRDFFWPRFSFGPVARQDSLTTFLNVNLRTRVLDRLQFRLPGIVQTDRCLMSRVIAASFAALVAASVVPTAASACYNCYTPQPCTTCYQPQYVAPQYRTVQENGLVSPGAVVAHRTPAQYRTVMVPQTVLVAPEGVQYERIAPQYETRQRVEMVAPARTYYTPVAPRCGSCGY